MPGHRSRIGVVLGVLFLGAAGAAEEAAPGKRDLDQAREACEAAVRKAREALLAQFEAAIADAVQKGDAEAARRLREQRREFLKSIDSDYAPAKPRTLPVEPQELEAYVGRYPRTDGSLLVVSREGARLFVGEPGAWQAELLPVARDRFVRADTGAVLTFYRDAAEKVDEVVCHGLPETARRFDEAKTHVLRVEANIDGKSRLVVGGNTVQWLHLDWCAPGRFRVNAPTRLNDVAWYPVWPDLGDWRNNWGCCASSRFLGLEPPLPRNASDVAVAVLQARGPVTVIDRPCAGNDFALMVEFDDHQMQSSDYAIEIYWPKDAAGPAAAQQTAEGEVPTRELTLYLPFNGDATDASGHGRHGEAQGVELAADRFGQPGAAYAFRGEASFIRVPPPPRQAGAPLSVSLWANYAGDDLHRHAGNTLISQDSEDGRVWQLSTIRGRIAWHRMRRDPDLYPASRVVPGVWYHVVAVFDGTHHALYLDGELVDRKAGRLGAKNAVPIFIGRKDWPEPDHVMPFAGTIDDVRLYDRAVTRAEVKALYHEKGFGRYPLVEAAKGGHLEAAKKLLADGAEVDVPDKEGRTALSWAADRGHGGVAELLLADRARADLADARGLTPLHAAARSGHARVLELLIAAGAEVNATTAERRTPLHLAAAFGHTECASLLLGAGANANARDSAGNTPLHRAAAYRHEAFVEALVKAGADARLENDKAQSAADVAHQFGWAELAARLEQHIRERERGTEF